MLRSTVLVPSIFLRVVKSRNTKPMLENGPCKALRFQPKPSVEFGFATNQPGVSQAQLNAVVKKLNAAVKARNAAEKAWNAAEKALRAEMDKDSEIWGAERVKNVATQVLLFALGDQPRKLCSKVHARFVHIATTHEFQDLAYRLLMSRGNALKLAKQFDLVISTSKKTVHFTNTQDLEYAVIETLDLFERRKTLKAKYPDEFSVLKNFGHFKTVYPSRFGP